MAKKQAALDIDPNFVSPKPTLVLTATVRGTTVVTKLFGEVSEARKVQEQAATSYRAEQLAPAPPKRERVERDPFDFRDEARRDELNTIRRFEEFDNSIKSGGRR